jgi:hypothetical protein
MWHMSTDNSLTGNKKDLLWEKIAEAIREIQQFPESHEPTTLSFQQYVEDEIIPYLMAKGKFKECQLIETNIICEPCPYHPSDKKDRYVISQSAKFIARCFHEKVLESEFLTLHQIKMLQKLARKKKIVVRRFR